MKHLLNTLYITTQSTWLHRETENVVVEVNKEVKLRVPLHTLSGIVCFGVVSVSPPLMSLCMERNVAISFLSENGAYYGKVVGPIKGNVLLRKEQFRRAENETLSADIARNIVAGKIVNARMVLMRAARDNPNLPGLHLLIEAAKRIGHLLKYLKNVNTLDVIRGKEGYAANEYFNVFDHLILAQKDQITFRGRNRRPPLDPVNALLSFVYTLLVHDVESALEVVGLDPYVGFLHCDRPGRPSLALDMMEELRPYLADRLVLSLINRQQIKSENFTVTETGAVSIDKEGKKTVLVAYQERKREEIKHPFLNERVQIGLLPYIQSMLLGRYLRGDIDSYPPFVWR